MGNGNSQPVSVNVNVSLTLDLPPETAKIVSNIRVGDREFIPSGDFVIDVPAKLVADAVDEIEVTAPAKPLKIRVAGKKTAVKVGVRASTKPGKPKRIACALPECGVMFVPKNKRSRFHSPQCAQKAYQKAWYEKKKAAKKPTAPRPRPAKAAATFGAAGAPSDTPVGRRPLTIGDTPTRLPASMGRQGD